MVMSEITLKEAKKILAEIMAEARPQYSTEELEKRGEKSYKQLKEHLEPKHKTNL